MPDEITSLADVALTGVFIQDLTALYASLHGDLQFFEHETVRAGETVEFFRPQLDDMLSDPLATCVRNDSYVGLLCWAALLIGRDGCVQTERFCIHRERDGLVAHVLPPRQRGPLDATPSVN